MTRPLPAIDTIAARCLRVAGAVGGVPALLLEPAVPAPKTGLTGDAA
ncbi:hypothetical protein SAMN05444007_11246 [Cribrihabitans marinus]|uniref:Uncharacterized protein n=1 Tax=Cribrihabitans marinus TaxID=1227549 RepID=A0A1H7DML0_9RHOB|nr:hypothetical protein [Cribrihabitans marinus]SEK02999.1 hypothetical protein SAMN05444007_11246 [Cribrihabitans marinus]